MLIKDGSLRSHVITGLLTGTACLVPELVHNFMSDPPAVDSMDKVNNALECSAPSALAEQMHPDLKKAVLDSEKSIFGSFPAHLGYIGGGYYGLKKYLKHKAAKARRALAYMHY